ncbi:energy-coupling factor transporter ATP-binding protein EcfA1 [Paraliobacillus quinghaiensis]|uniref:Energy-coupling factor transporter ATP-binding protein EcfA1 n=1 Tax=Paraliobacillus quinghaiensis TaxID=470815 RepID=A0A917WWM4_9BACI|nr:energy-coupling factor transporter ATPase [Paraliobacillus quinghaiensis]GGM36498.1 energy-coupling factor transporter ATP-binding protein EcfA1 [Paraliobacillus quinghaiensis]
MARPTILEVNDLTFRYDLRKDNNTLSSVSFSVQQGEWVAIVGDNGSGKSTLARLIVGLLEAEKGTITIDNEILSEDTKWRIREKIGLVFQNPENQFIGTTVQDDVAFGLENNNMPYEDMKLKIEDALQLVGMETYRLKDPSQLSGGQMQRVAIAGILALKPDVILLDEAFVMLDPQSRRGLFSTLKYLKENENITIISITHDRNEAALADRILVMDEGKLIQEGTPKEVFSTNNQLEPPFAEQLRRKLNAKGRKVPQTYMTEDEMVKWLCR